MVKTCFPVVIMEIILLFLNYSNGSPIVHIKKRQIIGQTIEPFRGSKVNRYFGIPYAEPPVGVLRFKKPVPLQRVSKQFNAVKIPPACLQLLNIQYPWYINGSHKSEDCLFLNIWTPVDANPENLKAVMFWMHGGAFRFGSIQDPLYNGAALTAIGDIIVVTVNYRLGAFGFLTTDTTEAPGNAGLWDVLEALKWVNANIGYFGGDVARITVAGESAGSIFVGYLSESPLAQDLFSQQIMESGSPQTLLLETKLTNLAFTELLAKKVGCANHTHTLVNHRQYVTDCLKKVKAEELERAEFELVPTSTEVFLPQYGDEILPRNPRRAVLNGDFRCKKLLIGNNRDEGSNILPTNAPEIFGPFGEKNAQINQTIAIELVERVIEYWSPYHQTAVKSPVFDTPLVKDLSDITPKVLQNVLDTLLQNVYNYSLYTLYTFLGDLLFLCPDEYYAEKCAEKGGDVYFYFFVHRPSITPWPPWMGVVHYEEVQFVFGKPLLHPHLYLSSEVKLSRDMVLMWSNFVKTGKPNQRWPLYSKGNPVFKYFSTHSVEKYGKGPRKASCNLLRVVHAL